MKILFRLSFVFIIFSLLIGATSCRTRAPKEYIEKNGLHSDKKPKELAKEFGEAGKKQKKAYRKEMYKRWKKMHPGEKRKQNPYR